MQIYLSNMRISSVFKEIRVKYNKTQQELADSINVSRGTISQIEGGRANPTIEIIEKIINLYGVDANVFFNSKNIIVNNEKESTIEKNEISAEFVIKELRSNYAKLSRLYQRIVDIKMMSEKQKAVDIKDELFEFIDDFADIQNQYFCDLSYTENGINPYKVKHPVNINDLSEKQLKDYLIKLQNNLDLFENMFFDYFNKFYNEYMKNWYLK